MIYIDENGNPIQETDELQEAIDDITDKLAQMTKEERLAWFEQSICPEPLKLRMKLTVRYISSEPFLIKLQAKALKKNCEEL